MDIESQSKAVNVQAIMREVRLKVRQEHRQREEIFRSVRRSMPLHLPASIARLKASSLALRDQARRLGDVPPGPSTIRAKIGALLVAIMQRALFWLLPQLKTTQQQMADALVEHVSATEDILKALQQTTVDLELLRRSLEKQPLGEARECSRA